MRLLLWHVHGGWTDAFVRGAHDYLLPTNQRRDAWGLGRGGREWPPSVIEVPVGGLRDAEIDAVVLQRPEEFSAVQKLTGRVPGRDLPAVYLEHNTPKGDVPQTRHPLADQDDIVIAHVTHFNRLIWDTGRAPTTVIEHGIVDPGLLYTGELGRVGVVVNEPVRRGRVTGTDLLPRFAEAAPLDVFGMGAEGLPALLGFRDDNLRVVGDLPTRSLHRELARRRLYLHPLRWTSLGLSLLEAMQLGMPVVALEMTEASRAVPPEAGTVSNDLSELVRAIRELVADPALAAAKGRAARAHALEHYGLDSFLAAWDTLLTDVTESPIRRAAALANATTERRPR